MLIRSILADFTTQKASTADCESHSTDTSTNDFLTFSDWQSVMGACLVSQAVGMSLFIPRFMIIGLVTASAALSMLGYI